jgi:hypothetical protein
MSLDCDARLAMAAGGPGSKRRSALEKRKRKK